MQSTPESLRWFNVPPVEIISKPFAARPLAKSATPLLSLTLIKALFIFPPLEFLPLSLCKACALAHEPYFLPHLEYYYNQL